MQSSNDQVSHLFSTHETFHGSSFLDDLLLTAQILLSEEASFKHKQAIQYFPMFV